MTYNPLNLTGVFNQRSLLVFGVTNGWIKNLQFPQHDVLPRHCFCRHPTGLSSKLRHFWRHLNTDPPPLKLRQASDLWPSRYSALCVYSSGLSFWAELKNPAFAVCMCISIQSDRRTHHMKYWCCVWVNRPSHPRPNSHTQYVSCPLKNASLNMRLESFFFFGQLG